MASGAAATPIKAPSEIKLFIAGAIVLNTSVKVLLEAPSRLYIIIAYCKKCTAKESLEETRRTDSSLYEAIHL